MHDLAIRGATVYDGLGNAGQTADVCVTEGRITHIGPSGEAAQREVNACGLALMPGIVDLHTHFDAQVTWDRTLSPSPALGVTTAVMGNCGFGIAPCPADQRELMLKNLSVVEGMDLDALLSGVNWQFESFGQYMDQLRSIGPYINTAVFAGHSVIRTAVMGEAACEQEQATPEQIQAMVDMVRDAMNHGAIGFASSYSPNHSGYGGRPMPSTIATDAELHAMTDVLGQCDRGVFMMATGSRAHPEFMEDIARKTSRPTFISTVLAMYNDATPELALTYYDKCAQAQARGHPLYMLTSCQPLSFDFSLRDPYILISHSAFDQTQGLHEAGLKAVYADASFRQAFRANLASPKSGVLFLGNWALIELGTAATDKWQPFNGQNLAQIANTVGQDPLDVFFDMALDEGLDTHFVGKFFNNNDEGVAPLLRHDAGVITLSDAGAHLIYMCDAGFGLHLLAHWVRDKGVFSLPEGIRRLTSHAAERFRIPNRGAVVHGKPADLLLFDPDTVGISGLRRVNDLPSGGSRMVREPLGVHGVWVNGTLVHDGQSYTPLPKGPGAVLTEFLA